jgi:hypothetical protein
VSILTTVREATAATRPLAPPSLSVTIDIDLLVEVERRHVKLTPQATRLIKGELALLFQIPAISGSARTTTTAKSRPAADLVITTQEAADLVGVSRPDIVARIEAGYIPLHQ